jgi:hypothetical protein
LRKLIMPSCGALMTAGGFRMEQHRCRKRHRRHSLDLLDQQLDDPALAANFVGGVLEGQNLLNAGKIDLWTYDHYHASAAGYYLEALTIFADITGRDPRTFGKDEQAAAELGISPETAVRLQAIAWDASTGDGRCPTGAP